MSNPASLSSAPLAGELDLRRLLDSLTDHAVVLLDPAGVVRTWNQGAERLLGYSAAEAVGKTTSRFYLSEETEAGQRALAEAQALGKSQEAGWRVRQDGTRFWAS